ncbi:MAG: hypothetical protein AB9882_06710 [Ignavibacteriaceae bacterium]
MNTKSVKELLYKKLDGNISGDEEKLLEELLQKYPGYRKEEEALSLLSNVKRGGNEVKLGGDFADCVMYKIKNNNNKNSARFTMANSNSSIGSKLAMAFIFIFGLLLGGGLIFLSLNSEAEDEQIKYFSLFGMMGDTGTMSDFIEADNYHYDHSDLNVDIKTKYNNDMIVLEYEVYSAEKVNVTMTYDERNLRFYASKKFFETTETSLLTSSNLIRVENRGKNKYIFLFVNQSRRPANINVTVQKGIETISESKLISNK